MNRPSGVLGSPSTARAAGIQDSATARAAADRFYAAFNARDLDAWVASLTDDVRIQVDSLTLHGRASARAYVEGVIATYPGVLAAHRETLSATSDTVVSEFQLVNPNETADADGRAEADTLPWRLAGTLCEILRLRSGRITSVRSYYLPTDRDRTVVAEVPSRAEAARIADEQTALRSVASGVARGAPASEVFAAVDRAIADIAGADLSALLRFEPDGQASVLASTAAGSAQAPAVARLHVGADLGRLRDGATFSLWPAGTLRTVLAATADGAVPPDQPALAVPIRLGGAVWGLTVLAAPAEPSAADTAARITEFAEFVGPALAAAQATAELRQLADEQASLRRIAELAAREAPADEMLQAVADEAARLAGVRFSTLLRYEDDGTTEVVALSGPPPGVAVGMRASGDGDGATQRAWRTRAAARVDDLTRVSGLWPELARRHGYSSSVAVPIPIRERLWGVLVVVGKGGPLPGETEEHLRSFAELAGTGISAAEARLELRTLADEQGALRRVAELAARGAALDAVFAAAAREASALFDGSPASLARYTDSGDAEVVAVTNSPAPLGLRIPLTDDTGTGVVHRTGRAYRVQDFTVTSLADVAADLGVRSAVTVPVTVEGHVWGALSVASTGPPVPPDAVDRLAPFADLAAAAIATAQTRDELLASRARVLTTADDTRRRVQRDVHDGAQQRLVHTIINLKLARDDSARGLEVTDLIADALRSAEQANQELRDVVRGILPAALTRGGLRPGIESLMTDTTIPVRLTFDSPRLPAATETTAYFVVAEALTNVVKHAEAAHAWVDVRLDHGRLVLEVRDDGKGGADPRRGSGLTGLFDRVAAGDGLLIISSPPGVGTHVHASLPVAHLPG